MKCQIKIRNHMHIIIIFFILDYYLARLARKIRYLDKKSDHYVHTLKKLSFHNAMKRPF